MRKTLALVVLLFAASCSSATESTTTAAVSTTDTTTSSTTSTAPQTSTTTSDAPTTSVAATTSAAPTTTVVTGGIPAIRLDEIVFAGDPYLIITNRGDGAGSTEGHFICRFPDYYELPAVALQPGERLAVPLGEGEVPELVGVVATADVRSPLGPISATDGELGLYSRNEFNSDDAILDYVEWGSSGHARSGVAAAAGIWVTGGFVEVPAELLAIVAQAFPTDSPEDWLAEIGG
ncbi:MAG: hypothetical protein HKN91_02405 [Acidimicrobiia bacterium]|nr:hypothetical protein [Acidimicrobiia bacterium]